MNKNSILNIKSILNKNSILNKKTILVAVASVFTITSALTMTGCLPQYYSDDFSKRVVEDGTQLLTEYLDAHYSDYSMGEVTMQNASSLGNGAWGVYGSTIAGASVFIEDEGYRFYADTNTGLIYDTTRMELVEQYFLNGFGEMLADIDTDIFYTLDNVTVGTDVYSYSSNDSSKLNSGNYDVLVTLYGAFEVNTTDEEILELIKHNIEYQSVSILCLYSSEEKSLIAPERLKQFLEDYPLVYSVSAYNIEQEYYALHAEDREKILHNLLNTVDSYTIQNTSLDGITYSYYSVGSFEAGSVGVKYIDEVIDIGGKDFKVLSDVTRECPATFMGSTLTIDTTTNDSAVFVYLTENVDYSEINITEYNDDGEKYSSYPLKAVEVLDCYYSLADKDSTGAGTGFYTIRKATIDFVK